MQDEAIKKLIADEKELTRQGTVLDYVKVDLEKLNLKVDNLITKIDDKYVSREEFVIYKKTAREDVEIAKAGVEKINKAIYWAVGLVLGAVILAILGLVLSK